MLKLISDLFLKVFPKNKPPPPPNFTWKDILKIEKKRRNMISPSKRVILWKTEEQQRRSREKNQPQFVNVQFKFSHDGSDFLMKTQRNFEQKLISDAFPKISNLIRKRMQKKEIEFDESEKHFTSSPQSSQFITEESTIEDLLIDIRIQTVLVNGEEFQVVRDGMPIQSIMLGVTPLVGFYCMPTVYYNYPPSHPVQNHWFVNDEVDKQLPDGRWKQPTKRDSESLKFNYKNEKTREFSVEGYSFRSSGLFFVPDEADLSRRVVVLTETGEDHPVFASISSRPIMPAPDEIITDEQVRWCRKNRLDREKPEIIRVMTYNILADLYLNLNLAQEILFFNYCEKQYQRSFYRTPILLKQLSDLSKTGVCLMFLQEVDVSRHDNFIEPFVRTINYRSTLAKKLLSVSEGVAIVFDAQKFELIETESIGLADLAQNVEILENDDIRRMLESSEETKERFLTRPTIVQIVVLEDKTTESLLLCANTHLHHNPTEEHIKVIQSLVCVRKIWSFYRELREKTDEKKKIRIMFGGDFNSTPDGPIYTLFSTGNLPKTDEVWKLDEKFEAEDLTIEKPFICLSGTPEYTNYTANTKGFIGCLDYIWGIDMSTEKRCPMPEKSKITRYTALPSQTSPSDHLPVITDIKLE